MTLTIPLWIVWMFVGLLVADCAITIVSIYVKRRLLEVTEEGNRLRANRAQLDAKRKERRDARQTRAAGSSSPGKLSVTQISVRELESDDASDNESE